MPWAVNFDARRWVDGLGALVWRPRCLLCGDPGHAGLDLCAACGAALPWNLHACAGCALPLPAGAGDAEARPAGPAADTDPPGPLCGACLCAPPPVTATHAAFAYLPPLDRLLPRLKFHQDMAAGRLLARLCAQRLARAPRPQALIPVPLHRDRLRRRGYDQALELARPLARRLGLPLRDDLLERVRPTRQQSRLDAAARRRNVRGAFAVDARARMPGHVALFDDVMTTGATLHAAARALRRAGVQRVDAWVCARVP